MTRPEKDGVRERENGLFFLNVKGPLILMSREARAETSCGAALWQKSECQNRTTDGSVMKQKQNGQSPAGGGMV